MVESLSFADVSPSCALDAPATIACVHTADRRGPDLVAALDAALVTLLARKVAAAIVEMTTDRP